MAMSATMTQVAPAVMGGSGTTFVLTVSNSSGSPVNVNSIAPFVISGGNSPSSAAAAPVNLEGPFPTVGLGIAQVGGSQWNIQVPAAGSVNFTFQAQFFGGAINGAQAQATPSFAVGATVQSSDGSVFGPQPLQVVLNYPTLGQPGSPPPTPPLTGQLQFTTPASAQLLL